LIKIDIIFRCTGCGRSERKVLEEPVEYDPSNVNFGVFCLKNGKVSLVLAIQISNVANYSL